MPKASPWGQKALLPDTVLVTYKFPTGAQVKALESQGVDVEPYRKAQLVNQRTNLHATPARQAEIQKNFACEKRKLLQELANRSAKECARQQNPGYDMQAGCKALLSSP
jgi:uncharacterized membrane-anchored protein YhcB (DUF1043 family)